VTVAGTPQHPQDPFDAFSPYPAGRPRHAGPLDPPPARREEVLAAVSYAAVVVGGPVVPLAVYLTARRGSPFVRRHAAQALNVALTALLYAVSGTIVGVLLSFDNADAALFVMVPIAVAAWLVMLAYLARAAVAANRGGFRQIPAFICSPLIK
jgi:uncharacterized Tic20 family protein